MHVRGLELPKLRVSREGPDRAGVGLQDVFEIFVFVLILSERHPPLAKRLSGAGSEAVEDSRIDSLLDRQRIFDFGKGIRVELRIFVFDDRNWLKLGPVSEPSDRKALKVRGGIGY